jgi:hypothetical protein
LSDKANDTSCRLIGWDKIKVRDLRKEQIKEENEGCFQKAKAKARGNAFGERILQKGYSGGAFQQAFHQPSQRRGGSAGGTVVGQVHPKRYDVGDIREGSGSG